jgi:membrane-bound lytic murein transglycosylase D
MRIGKLYLLIAALTALAWGSTACQSAQHSATLLPSGAATAPLLTQATAPPPPPAKPAAAPQTQPAPKPDPAADLVVQVEKEYQTGQDNYKAGHLDAAKDNFDRAFNLLLGSSLDIRSDPRFQQEFDRVLDGVNGLELQALQQGDGFTEQKSEPAPIDEANDTTVPVDPNVKAKAEAQIKATHSDLPLMMTDQVAGYISYFSNRGRGTLERALARSGLY